MKMNRLREVMEREHVTQAQLARVLGVYECEVSRWVYGIRTPRLETALKIARMLNTSVECIWGGKQEEIPSVTFSREQAERIHKIIFGEGIVTS